MKDARSYAGAEHKSDHRIVVCRLTLDKYYLVFKKKPPAAVKYCVTSLWSDRDLRHQYQDAIRQTVNSKEYPDDPSERLDMLEADIKDCAEKTLGIQKGTRKPYHSDDPKIKALVRKKNDLRSNINSSADQRREIMKDVRLVESGRGELTSEYSVTWVRVRVRVRVGVRVRVPVRVRVRVRVRVGVRVGVRVPVRVRVGLRVGVRVRPLVRKHATGGERH